jgi:hypothetical protein
MRGSLKGMFDMKPYDTDKMVGNNETMASISKGQYKGFVLQNDGTTLDISSQKSTTSDCACVPLHATQRLALPLNPTGGSCYLGDDSSHPGGPFVFQR